MTERRFTDKPDLDPSAVMTLDEKHPAMLENRTLFPGTVVEVTQDQPDRILVSGHSNRKLGKTVAKGRFKGYALYSLSLEERATCPMDCDARSFCYGNSMHQARRHRIGDPDVFFDRLALEICDLLDEHPGLLIRLHVLGDFPDTEYVSFWKEVLDEHPNVAVFGYTHRLTTNWGGDGIGDAIKSVKDAHPERFRIRWSSQTPRPDGAYVTSRIPKRPRIDEGLVCPAQTDATACCASCGLCWSMDARNDTIVFVKHGKAVGDNAAQAAMTESRDETRDEVRKVRPIELPSGLKSAPANPKPPEIRVVDPETLLIESAYQRDLSAKSMRLIRKVVAEWDWCRFKPPVASEHDGKLYVIDGQHTAIAAATHQYVKEIPVLVAPADRIETRAASFVSHNRDRINMTPAQVFYADCTAGEKEAKDILKIVVKAGAEVPRNPVPKAKAKPGQILAIVGLKRIYKTSGPEITERVLRIAVASQIKPVSAIVLRALHMLLTEPFFSDVAALGDEQIAAGLAKVTRIESRSRGLAEKTGQSQYRIAAIMISKAAGADMALPEVKADSATTQRPRDEVEERLWQIERALRDDNWMPGEWNLTSHEAMILNALADRSILKQDQLHTLLYGDDPNGGPDPKVIEVYICKMRPKLKEHGIVIETKWGNGYLLTAESKQIIAEIKKQREPA